MKRLQPALCLESLEPRDCPSITAGLNQSNLVVQVTTPTNGMTITEVSQGDFQVFNNGNQVAQVNGVTGDLRLNMTSHDMAGVTIELNGNSINNLFANLGNHGNALTILDGTIKGNMDVRGGVGNDGLDLAGDGFALTVKGNTHVNLGAGTQDTVVVNSLADLKGNLTVDSANNILLEGGSIVEQDAFLHGGVAANNVLLNGQVGGNAWFFGGNSADNINLTGYFQKDVHLQLRGGTDAVNFTGYIGQNLFIQSKGFVGNKTVELAGSINGNANIQLGKGNDIVDFMGHIAGNLSIDTGTGQDQVFFRALSSVQNVFVQLGSGNDLFRLEAGAGIWGSAFIHGGRRDIFSTSYSQANFPGNIHVLGFGHVLYGV